MTTPLNVLFVCTHNSCRSIIAEAVARERASDYLNVASVGSAPSGRVNADALTLLRNKGIATDKLNSKSWQDLDQFKADLIITVCDQAAKEPCPVSQQHAMQIHWGLADPSAITESSLAKQSAFEKTYQQIEELVQTLITLETNHTRPHELQATLEKMAPKQVH